MAEGQNTIIPIIVVIPEKMKRALTEEHEALKRELATPVGNGMTQTHTLIEKVQKAEDKLEVRNRLRSKIANVVMGGWVRVIAPYGGPPPDDLAFYLSHALTTWFRNQPHLKIRCVLPIN